MSTSEHETPTYGYEGTVVRLLTYGQPSRTDVGGRWPDYTALGFAQSDVPNLIAMAQDEVLNQAPGDNPEVWAPLHAWRALGQLGATSATQPLLSLMEQLQHDDWAIRELPDVFAMLGPATLHDLQTFLADSRRDDLARVSAAEAIKRVGLRHEGTRDTCAFIIQHQLTHHQCQQPHVNGFLVADLIHLNATEAIETIREAFRQNNVDVSIIGDAEEVELWFGLRTQRSTPRPKSWIPQLLNRQLHRAERPQHHGKVGRNEPCPCGSGRKYKRCCGR